MTTEVFDDAVLRAQLEEDEGIAEYPYVDTLGNTSIGIGHNLSTNGLGADVITLIYNDDSATAKGALDAKLPWWRSLPVNQQYVMANLCFNMGWPVFSSFVRFIAAMQAGNIPTAVAELQNSAWYTQVGLRGPRMIARLTAPSTT
jgi:lysozyme